MSTETPTPTRRRRSLLDGEKSGATPAPAPMASAPHATGPTLAPASTPLPAPMTTAPSPSATPPPAATAPPPTPEPPGGPVRKGTLVSSPDTEGFFQQAATNLDAASTGIPVVRQVEPMNLQVVAAVAAGIVVLGLIFVGAVMYL